MQSYTVSISEVADKLEGIISLTKKRKAESKCGGALDHLWGYPRKELQSWIQKAAFWEAGECFEIQ